MSHENAAGTLIICVAIFVGAILATYFLSKILVGIGGIVGLISFILLIIGFILGDGQLTTIGAVGLLVGAILYTIGTGGVDFFEKNPTGMSLLDASNTIVNATGQGIQTYVEATEIK